GIGTSVGKTIAAAALTERWSASYWKPIQSGDLVCSDSMMIRALGAAKGHIFPEAYRLNTAASPHYAAQIDDTEIRLADFQLPQTSANLIVEGAGGLLVPLNEEEFIVDLIAHLGSPVILVCADYLGSINHSLLSFALLENKGI